MIFPNIKAKPLTKINLDNLKEIAWDFESDTPIIHNNDFVMAAGIEALRVWVYKTLKTQRYRYITYSNSYGVTLNDLIGKMYDTNVEREIKKEITEALLVNEYIDRVNILNLLLDGNKLNIDLKISTRDGYVEVSVDV